MGFTTRKTEIQGVTELVIDQVSNYIVGQKDQLRLLWTSLLVGGHVLLEGVPGLGKTKMVRAFSQVLGLDFARIQFTPDLMPSDVTGTKVYDLQSGRFSFRKGPIFTQLLLADEINRTPPKTQAALLEAMEEKQVTIDGETFSLPSPFVVIATQNPVEYEGTYSLPEAQLDRFALKCVIEYPSEDLELELLQEHSYQNHDALKTIVSAQDLMRYHQMIQQVTVEPVVVQYLLTVIRSTRVHPKVLLGASPRAGLSTLSLCKAEAMIQGRTYITPDDIKELIKPALRHRIILHPDAEIEGWTTDHVLEEILLQVAVPR